MKRCPSIIVVPSGNGVVECGDVVFGRGVVGVVVEGVVVRVVVEGVGVVDGVM